MSTSNLEGVPLHRRRFPSPTAYNLNEKIRIGKDIMKNASDDFEEKTKENLPCFYDKSLASVYIDLPKSENVEDVITDFSIYNALKKIGVKTERRRRYVRN